MISRGGVCMVSMGWYMCGIQGALSACYKECCSSNIILVAMLLTSLVHVDQ